MTNESHSQDPKRSNPTRRAILAAGGVAAAGVAASTAMQSKWTKREPVFIGRARTYAEDLSAVIRRGLEACGFKNAQFANRRVVLKPNLVEPNRRIPHMTTHPAMIIAAADVFRAWDADVVVAEAPGHVRDSLFALAESGVLEALRQNKLRFVDLNYEETTWRPNLGGFSGLAGLHLPRSIADADYIVSLPKLKTHHWVGMTATMKNFYGILPGIKYGWPKNVLHHNGIPETVVDINCCLPRTLGIVDAIECMEGDGPILGSMKPLGIVVVGGNLPAVDATTARIMGLEPTRVTYLSLAEHRLGPLEERLIEQRGERWQSVAAPFEIIDEEHLQRLRSTQTGPLTS